MCKVRWRIYRRIPRNEYMKSSAGEKCSTGSMYKARLWMDFQLDIIVAHLYHGWCLSTSPQDKRTPQVSNFKYLSPTG